MPPKESSPLVPSKGDDELEAAAGALSHEKKSAQLNQTWRSLQKETGPAFGWSGIEFPQVRTSIMMIEDFKHTPGLYYADTPLHPQRRERALRYRNYRPNPGTFLTAASAILNSKLRAATVFGHSQIWSVALLHVSIAAGLAIAYNYIHLHDTDFISGIKDFVDVCVTGVIFLLVCRSDHEPAVFP